MWTLSTFTRSRGTCQISSAPPCPPSIFPLRVSSFFFHFASRRSFSTCANFLNQVQAKKLHFVRQFFACAPWLPTACSVRSSTLWLPATPCKFCPSQSLRGHFYASFRVHSHAMEGRCKTILLLTCSNANCDQRPLGHKHWCSFLVLLALSCAARAPSQHWRDVFPGNRSGFAVPSTSMIFRTCHTWITSPPRHFQRKS